MCQNLNQTYTQDDGQTKWWGHSHAQALGVLTEGTTFKLIFTEWPCEIPHGMWPEFTSNLKHTMLFNVFPKAEVYFIVPAVCEYNWKTQMSLKRV